jgi:hypothetical protein
MEYIAAVENVGGALLFQGHHIASASWAFLNTNFSAALFGALAGAWTAHYIALRSEERKRLRHEIAGVNASIALANAVTNAFISFKRQNMRGMLERYKLSFDAFLAILATRLAHPTVFEYFVGFRELNVPFTPIAELRETLLDRVPSSGQALSIAIVLQQCITQFTGLIEARHRAIERLKPMNDADKASAYFGLRNNEGHIDERYADQMTGLAAMTDNGIYFPMLLCEILTRHGEKLCEELGPKAPKVSKIEYGPFEPSLLPDPADFSDFEKHFRPKQKNEAEKSRRPFAFFPSY